MSIRISYGWQDGTHRQYSIGIIDSEKREVSIYVGEINELVRLLAKASKDYAKQTKIWESESRERKKEGIDQ